MSAPEPAVSVQRVSKVYRRYARRAVPLEEGLRHTVEYFRSLAAAVV